MYSKRRVNSVMSSNFDILCKWTQRTITVSFVTSLNQHIITKLCFLMFSTLVKISTDDIFNYFSYFAQKTNF